MAKGRKSLGDMSLGEFDVWLNLRGEQMERDLRRAEQQVNAAADRMNKRTRLKLEIAGPGGVLIGLELASQAARGLARIMESTSEIVKGNFEAALEAAKQIPILGPIGAAVADAFDSLTLGEPAKKGITFAEARTKEHARAAKILAEMDSAHTDALNQQAKLFERITIANTEESSRGSTAVQIESARELTGLDQRRSAIIKQHETMVENMTRLGVSRASIAKLDLRQIDEQLKNTEALYKTLLGIVQTKEDQDRKDKKAKEEAAAAEKQAREAERTAKENAAKLREEQRRAAEAADRRLSIALRTGEALARIADNEGDVLRFKIAQVPADERRLAMLEEMARLVDEQRRLAARPDRTGLFGQLGVGVRNPQAAFGAPQPQGRDRQQQIAGILQQMLKQQNNRAFGRFLPFGALGVVPGP